MTETIVSKPLQKILSELTGIDRFDVALHLATKDLIRLKLKEAEAQIQNCEKRYGMAFDQFQRAWENDQIANQHDYEVEKDYWEWEAATTDLDRLREMREKIV